MNHTVETLAAAWQVSERTIRRLIKRQKLGYLSIGDRISIRPIDIENYEKNYARPAERAKIRAKQILQSA